MYPPVPQPQLKYNPATGVLLMIGQASGHRSTIPAHCLINLMRLKMGNNSIIAEIAPSTIEKLPRCPYPVYESIPAPANSSPLAV